MKLSLRYAVLASILLMAASCAHAPQLYQDSKVLQEERLAYVQSHPDGQYNSYIMNGEIAKGMNEGAVTASWGSPEIRRDVEKSQYEQWIYTSKDEVSGRWTIFSLAFQENVLVHWVITEDVITGQGVRPELEKTPVFSPADFDRENVDRAPIKKGIQ
jgi:hypothetical protein